MSNSLSCDVKRVALKLVDGLAGSKGEILKSMILNDQWDDFVNLTISPSNYSSAEDYFNDAASHAFLKKYETLPTKIDRKRKAVEKFFEAESKCYRTNQRLLPFIHNTFCCADEAILSIIDKVREKVIDLIGERPPSNPEGKFGPGATFSDRGGLTTIPDKMQSRPTLTHEAWPFLFPWSSTLWAKAAANRGETISFERGNRFTTVPKDAANFRGISIEASINVFYQLAFGKAMRRALKRNTCNKVDLEIAQDRHRQVACVASITGHAATIDLSQASDTISSALVKLIIPRRWHNMLTMLRSEFTTIQDGDTLKVVKLEKFSSMGNGYTFELETVIFMAICCAIIELKGSKALPGQNVHVFGDDIIVPTEHASDVIAALRFFGMDINKNKTFIDGPFRESCGGDYFNGRDVRPYYQKKDINEPQHYVGMVNGIRRMAFKDRSLNDRWPSLRNAWFAGLDSIPSHIRGCRGPEGLGDLCIHDEIGTWQSRTRCSIRYIRTYKPIRHREVKFDLFDYDVQLATATYGIMRTPTGNIVGRDSVLGYGLRWVPYS